jgi:3-hydroxyacyl-CoA dehydrogenase
MINRIGIIGCGKMGTDLFNFLNNFPFCITMIGKYPESVGNIKKAWLRKLNRSLVLGITDEDSLKEKAKQVKFSFDLNDLSETDLVIESITEDQKLKSELFKELDHILPPETIFTTNTSSIPLSMLVPSVRRSAVFLGLHFFYPVAMKNIVEINTTGNVNQHTLNLVTEFLNKTDRFFIALTKENHFLTNRLFLKLQAGAFNIHKEENTSIEWLDKLVSETLFPAGIFRFFDQVGNDIMYTSVKNYIANYPDRSFYEPLLAALKEKTDQNFLGVKSGKGFYDYTGHTGTSASLVLSDISAGKQKEISQKLLNYYLEPIENALLQKICSRSEMEHIVKEYTGF